MFDLKIIDFLSSAFSGKNNGRFGNFIKFVAFTSIFLGTIALILSLSILDGFDKALHQKAENFSAHIIIRSFTKEPIYNYPETINQLKSNYLEINNIQPIIEREGLIKSKSSVDGIMIRGIDQTKDITGIDKLIVNGKYNFSSNNAKEVLISRRLADKLDVTINQSIVIFALDGDSYLDVPEPKIAKYKIIGIYQSGMAKYDDVLIMIPFKTAEKFFNLPENSATSIEIMLNEAKLAPKVSTDLELVLKYPFYSITIYDIHQAMFSWIELQKEPIPMVLGIISIVAVLNIITALLVIVVEKTKTIGIIRTIGVNRNNILFLFVYQGMKIGFMGTLSGAAIAYMICYLQINYQIVKLDGKIYFLDVLPMDISLWHYQLVIGLSLLFTFISTIIPAFIATRINPVNSIRFR